MIEFMVLAAPRSGTMWAANWLTTDSTLCLHDPLFKYHYDALDAIKSTKVLGVACTGLAMFPDWVNAHPARKVILRRPIIEVNASLARLGLPEVPKDFDRNLNAIDGMHVDWETLFRNPEPMYQYLTRKRFDAERHAMLKEMTIERRLDRARQDPKVGRRLIAEMRRVVE